MARSADLTPTQLVKLKTGAKVPVYVGEPGDLYIAIEGAYKRAPLSLLRHEYVVLVYRRMLAGGRVVADMHFDKLHVTELFHLYHHCIAMDVAQLKESTADRICYSLQNLFPTVDQIEYVYRNAEDFVDTIVQSTARLLADPLVLDATPYYEYAQQRPDFNETLETAMEKILSARRKAVETIRARRNNRHKPAPQRCKDTPDNTTDLPTPSPEEAFQVQQPSRRRRRRTNKMGAATDAPKQEVEDKDIEVSSPARKTRTNQRTRRANAPHLIEVVSSGGGITTSAREARRGEMTRTGLII
ncbi:hypothetical protein H2201_001580 [Coniosporium apollinis]|uniref:BTB domain-containing protein n=1 Tax=Coniosporium apollinis TaxID=61459 RepID=A0ABQ9P4A7_9PEZI|nr:hypothetical protein H2201_001580 [Coniosporium apollinis]